MDTPEIDENNNMDNQEAPQSHCSRKFIVFEDCLDQLLQFCTICGRKCDIKKKVVRTMLVASRLCVCGEAFTWESQSLSWSMPTGNLVLSAKIPLSGCSIKQSLVLFQHANVSCFSEKTFQNIQQYYLVPALERVWKARQDALLDLIDKTTKWSCSCWRRC